MAASIRGVEDIAEAIRLYLTDHPNASDSADGVLRWWLGPQHFGDAVSQVEEALEQLVANGTMLKRTLPDGKVIYAAAATQSRGEGSAD